ncbi:MAG TPA: Gfo/Idh/MocA family oxidoreductase [Ktedonobacteraceae bacterium]|nr:Gfo/Idh/MocA family oxidoreductase [Ktedonobacteraceae bacterium]
MSDKKVRIGMGGIAYMHEAGYAEASDSAQIVAVCDVDEELARDRAIPYQARVYTDYHALIADAGVELVDITVPHHLHYPIALAALQQHKHVLVEAKPLKLRGVLRDMFHVQKRSGGFFWFVFGSFLIYMGVSGFQFFGVYYIEGILHITRPADVDRAIQIAGLLNLLIGMLFAVAAGLLSDKLGRARRKKSLPKLANAKRRGQASFTHMPRANGAR